MASTTNKHAAENNIVQLEEEQYAESPSLWQSAMRRIRQDRLTLAALTVLVILAILSFMAPLISQWLHISYTFPDTALKLLPPGTPGHPLGTDHLGRDMLARLLYGGRVSITIGMSAAFFSIFIGVTLGLLAGFYQGGPLSFLDDALMWFITTLNSIPTLLLLILLASVLNPTIPTLIFVLTLVSWSGTMRLIRGESISLRESEFIISAQAIGARPLRIMFNHILPNTMSVLLTTMAIQIGNIILTEAALSFLGLGVRPPEASWGNMLTAAQAHFRQGAHMTILPGLLIVITVLSLYLIGDGLRDAFDPRSTK